MESITVSAIQGATGEGGIDRAFSVLVLWSKLGLEIISALVVITGALIAIYQPWRQC